LKFQGTTRRIATMAEPRIATVGVTRVRDLTAAHDDDVVVVEEPLEIRVAWEVDGEPREKNISVTMRTPGDDADLAVGFLFTEGLIRSAAEIESARHWGSPNIMRVALRAGARPDTAKLDRHFYTTSSCGVCGKTSIEALRVVTAVLPVAQPVESSVVHRLSRALEERQSTFHATGSIHGAAAFDRTGELLRASEDIGRHNAVDKVIGALVRDGRTPASSSILMVSSRGSFEIVQKAIMAGIPTVASVGGTSSLAIELARDFGVTLIGFVRSGRFNVYSGAVA
jgi:FdhD protein